MISKPNFYFHRSSGGDFALRRKRLCAGERRHPEQRAACAPDAFRFCAGSIPDPTRVEHCLRQNKTDLSDGVPIGVRTKCRPGGQQAQIAGPACPFGGRPNSRQTRQKCRAEPAIKGDNEMNMLYIPALASFSGSASGTIASIVIGLVTQRRKDRGRHTLRATSQREELYKSFIEEASRLYADAIVNDKSEVSKLVDLYALIARMKILSNDAVIEAAEKAGRLILDTYLSPNKTFIDLPDLINEMDPLRDFSEACRRELQSADRR